jgi:H+/gluconate symporter-like permease
MIGLIGIVLSLVLLMYLAYKGYTVLVLAPLLALLAVLMSGGEPLLATYTQVFMRSLGNYLIQFFPLFALGAIFGKFMDDTGCARSIAHGIVGKLGPEQAVLAVVLACGILTYGGVSLFVVAFAVFPIAASLFREANFPKRLIPATIALGSFTFTMTALPGTPAIQNAIPIRYFGTDAFAAPGLGIIAGVIMLVGGVIWLRYRVAAAGAEGYGAHPDEAPAVARGYEDLPSLPMALAPIFVVIAVNYVLSRLVLPGMDLSYLGEPRFGGVQPGAVVGIWAIIVALVLAIVTLLALHWRRLENFQRTLNDGTMGSLLPIFNTSSEVGYGAVIAALPAFAIIKTWLTSGLTDNPLISLAVAVNVLAGITGSASGGMSIALEALGATYAQMAAAAGIPADILHRVAAISSGGFDCLPHNGAVITLLTICGLTHKTSYFDIAVVAVAIPVTALVVVIALALTVGVF